ncbi:MAG: hypothetical protein U0T68_01865 [Ferruginibacter sp.]
MIGYLVAVSYTAAAGAGIFKLLIKKDIVDICFGNRGSTIVVFLAV